MLGRRLAGRLNQLPGLVWFLVLDAGGSVLQSVSVFETASDLQVVDAVAGEWPTTHQSLETH